MYNGDLEMIQLPEQGILFTINNQLLSVDLLLIKEIMIPETTTIQLPMAPPLIEGLILSRETIYPLVNFGTQSSNKDNSEDARLLLLTDGERNLAIYADVLHDLIQFPSHFSHTSELISPLLQSVCDVGFETSYGFAYYLEFNKLYNTLISQANQLDHA